MAKARNIRKRAKRDENHNDVVKIFEKLGCSWLDTSHIGGALDGWLGCSGIDQRVEIKNPDADGGRKRSVELTPDEKDTFAEWRGRRPVIITTEQEAIDLVNKLRRETNADQI